MALCKDCVPECEHDYCDSCSKCHECGQYAGAPAAPTHPMLPSTGDGKVANDVPVRTPSWFNEQEYHAYSIKYKHEPQAVWIH